MQALLFIDSLIGRTISMPPTKFEEIAQIWSAVQVKTGKHVHINTHNSCISPQVVKRRTNIGFMWPPFFFLIQITQNTLQMISYMLVVLLTV